MTSAKVVFFTLWLFMPRQHDITGKTMSRGWIPAQRKMALTECSPMASAIRDVFRLEALCFMDGDGPDGPVSREVP